MVTRTVIHVTSPEAAALSATESAEVIKNASTATTRSPKGNDNENERGKKCDLPSGNAAGGNEIKKRKRTDEFVLDLSDVPPQQPIPKSKGNIKEGSSKYAGVTFHKSTNKWQAEIMIEGKQRYIGSYENEEEAAIDYARALFKYKGQEELVRARKRNTSTISIDLSDVPPQPLIPRSGGDMKEGASKYTGVCFNKALNKWKAQITIEGKSQYIGCYENEEEAAADYARAAFKYKGQGELDKAREQNSSGPAINIDLSDVPPQPPILKRKGRQKKGASKYTGVYFNINANKWLARITIDGKQLHIGYYENEEEAAIDYARAVFKYKGDGSTFST